MALDFLFKEKEEKYLKQIEEKTSLLEKKEKEIKNLKIDLKEVTNLFRELEKENDELKVELEKVKNTFSPKQLEIFERNLKKNMEDLKKYKDLLAVYKINPDKQPTKYRIEVKKLFSEKKYEDIVKKLSENNISFVDELFPIDFYTLLKDEKNIDEAKKILDNYKVGKYNWDINTALNKGIKLSKLFSSKKLLTVFSELNLEFADDISDFDFSILKEYGFKDSQINDFLSKREEYYTNFRIVEEVK